MCDAFTTGLAVFVVILLAPLLLVEILLLMFCGVRWLPPLSCMLNKSDLEGELDTSTLPPHPEIPADLLEKFDKVVMQGMLWLRPKGDDAATRVKTMCEAMLAYNVVQTVTDAPAEFQGVYWMDGNKIPEELVCLSYAFQSVAQDGQFVIAKVNSALSWTYLNSSFGKFIASFQESPKPSGMQAFAFESDKMQNGKIWSCTSFKYNEVNWLTSLGLWTMERLEGPGVNFKRGCYWFDKAFGRRLEFGSYNLRKIMNEDCTPVQPAYDDFVQYMSSTHKALKMVVPAPPGMQTEQASN